MLQRNQHLTHAMLRKPATTTPKQFQTTWCFGKDWRHAGGAGDLQSATVNPAIPLHLQNVTTAPKIRLLQWPFFASVTEWQNSGEHGCWLKVSSPACMSPVFAKAPCCLELFGYCCRRLSQHGVGEVLIPLRHCWRDAFSVFALAVDRFVTIGRRTAQFSFGLLMRCLFLGSPLRPPLCGSGCVCRPEFSIIRLKNNRIYM